MRYECWTAHREIALLFTDVGLPGGMNGRQLADEAQRAADARSRSYSPAATREMRLFNHGHLDPGVELIVKPFSFYSPGDKGPPRILDD